MLERGGEAERPVYEWPIAAVEARLRPIKLSRQELAAAEVSGQHELARRLTPGEPRGAGFA